MNNDAKPPCPSTTPDKTKLASAHSKASACCAPSTPVQNHGDAPPPPSGQRASTGLRDAVAQTLVDLKGGFFDMGGHSSAHDADLDSPPRRVNVSPFEIGRTTVTNRLFAEFVRESGYRTTAEIEGWSFVFHLLLENPKDHIIAPPETPWWRRVDGACWSAPQGPGSTVDAVLDHPVVHVSWHDANAFCTFTGTRLPREAEWEFAARGGRKRGLFPWGKDLIPNGKHLHNVWQGQFPFRNSADDGYVGTAPADAFPPNGYGMFNMTGNVWEWCADGFGSLPVGDNRPPRDPEGQDRGMGRVIRGGSYLCHSSYCQRYFVHSRTHNAPDSTTGNTGFRVVGNKHLGLP